MTFIPHDIEPRTLYISKAGNDKAGGDECPICLNTFEELASRIANLDPPPSQGDQAAAISLARGRYDPVSTVEFSAWCQVDMPTVTVADGNMASGPTYKAANTSGVVIQGVTSLLAGETAYSFDGTSRSGIEADAITSLFGGNALEMINGAEGSFCEVGQIIGDGTCVYIDTQGDRPSISNSNIVDMVADGATGYYVNVKDGVPCFMKGNAVRLAASPFGGGTPTTATALKIISGDTITFDYQLVQGDIELDGGKSTLHIQHYKDGKITQTDGEHYLDTQIIEADIDCLGGLIIVGAQEIEGNITVNSASTQFSVSTQLLTGDITFGSAASVNNILALVGSFTSSSGNHYLSSDLVFFNVNATGGSLRLSLRQIGGDFTVSAGAVVTGQIDEVSGSINITGTFNGEIAGVKYGTWIDGNELLATFYRNANVPNSWDNIGYLQIDTGDEWTDTVDYITVQYRQNSSGSRTHKFRIIDADDEVTVYFEGDSGSVSGSGNKNYDVSVTPVNALPVNSKVNLALEHERDGGAGLADSSIQIGLTRV